MLLCSVGFLTSWKTRCWRLATDYVHGTHNKSFKINETRYATISSPSPSLQQRLNWIKWNTKSKSVSENGSKGQSSSADMGSSYEYFHISQLSFSQRQISARAYRTPRRWPIWSGFLVHRGNCMHSKLLCAGWSWPRHEWQSAFHLERRASATRPFEYF